MSNNNQTLPQLGGQYFLTDSGLETTLIFHHGIDLPHFSTFELLQSDAGIEILRNYYEQHAQIAIDAGRGFVLESPTWRVSRAWAQKMGLDSETVSIANRRAIALMTEIRDSMSTASSPMAISGNIGPRGDGYVADKKMTRDEASVYHREQATILADAGVDLISSVTLNYVEEAIGIAVITKELGVPVVLSFTTETDGRLPDGNSLQEAIEAVDLATNDSPAYYMINCAHTEHFSEVLEENAAWVDRIRGLRTNASKLSHAELDEAEVLDDGNPTEFGIQHEELLKRFPQIAVVGGCCGTDHRHIMAVAK